MSFTKQYQSFFNSEAGQFLLKAIEDMIESNHVKAEEELTTHYSSKASGNREVIKHIQSMVVERKEKPTNR